jgi:hypothetical protein
MVMYEVLQKGGFPCLKAGWSFLIDMFDRYFNLKYHSLVFECTQLRMI